jgi:hypothetical protein
MRHTAAYALPHALYGQCSMFVIGLLRPSWAVEPLSWLQLFLGRCLSLLALIRHALYEKLVVLLCVRLVSEKAIVVTRWSGRQGASSIDQILHKGLCWDLRVNH